MSAVTDYLRNIGDAVTTTLEGMRITLRYWVKEPAITVEYPDRLGPGVTVDDLVPEGYRGLLGLHPEKCIGCLQCMRACPIACIRVVVEKGPAGRMLDRFEVNQAKCMHCGLCVETCPTNALVFTKRFEGACYDIRDLRVRLLQHPVPVAVLRKGGGNP